MNTKRRRPEITSPKRTVVGGIRVSVPRALQIRHVAESVVESVVRDIALAQNRRTSTAKQQIEQPEGDAQSTMLASIATNAWRLRSKMTLDNGEPKEDTKRLYRHVEAIYDSLKEAGVEVEDFRGRRYDSGMAVKVISFEETPGFQREEIKETIKPTVLFKGKRIQIGEVIVGTP